MLRTLERVVGAASDAGGAEPSANVARVIEWVAHVFRESSIDELVRLENKRAGHGVMNAREKGFVQQWGSDADSLLSTIRSLSGYLYSVSLAAGDVQRLRNSLAPVVTAWVPFVRTYSTAKDGVMQKVFAIETALVNLLSKYP